MFNLRKKTDYGFLKWFIPFFISNSSGWKCYFTSLYLDGIVFNPNRSNKYSVMIFIYISLMINDVKHFLMCLFIILYVLLCEVAIQVFFPFFKAIFFWLSLENFLYILDGHLLPGFLFFPPKMFSSSLWLIFLSSWHSKNLSFTFLKI